MTNKVAGLTNLSELAPREKNITNRRASYLSKNIDNSMNFVEDDFSASTDQNK